MPKKTNSSIHKQTNTPTSHIQKANQDQAQAHVLNTKTDKLNNQSIRSKHD